jgi:hypothetical protein
MVHIHPHSPEEGMTVPLPPQKMERFGTGHRILKMFYSCTIESILTGRITTWYGKCTALDRKALQRVVPTAQYITGAELPAIPDVYIRRAKERPQK